MQRRPNPVRHKDIPVGHPSVGSTNGRTRWANDEPNEVDFSAAMTARGTDFSLQDSPGRVRTAGRPRRRTRAHNRPMCPCSVYSSAPAVPQRCTTAWIAWQAVVFLGVKHAAPKKETAWWPRLVDTRRPANLSAIQKKKMDETLVRIGSLTTSSGPRQYVLNAAGARIVERRIAARRVAARAFAAHRATKAPPVARPLHGGGDAATRRG